MKKLTFALITICILLIGNVTTFSQDEKKDVKKYNLEIKLTKDLEFTRSTKVAIKNKGSYNYNGLNQSNESAISTAQELKFKVLDFSDDSISKLRIEFHEQTRKSDESNDYESKQLELLKKIQNEWIIVKYTDEGYELIETSDKIKSILESKDNDKNNKFNESDLLDNYFKYEIVIQPVFGNIYPGKDVEVGESWEMNVTDFLRSPISKSYQQLKGSGEKSDEQSEKEKAYDIVNFKLEKVESTDGIEIATVSFNQTVESSDSYDMPGKNTEQYDSRSVFTGSVLFDLKKNLIISMRIEVISTSVSYRNKKQFGNASFSSIGETTYKYTE